MQSYCSGFWIAGPMALPGQNALMSGLVEECVKAIVLIRKLLGGSAVTKSRAGFVTATVALFTMGCKIGLIDTNVLQDHGAYICIGLGLTGFILWGAGRWNEAKRARFAQDQETLGEQPVEQHPLAFLRSSKYWGLILIVSAAMITGITAYRRPQFALAARTQVTITNIVTITNFVTVTITNQKPVVTFPRLALSGVVVNGAQSAAVINGRVLHLGEMLGSVTLVGVDPGHALIALQGETNALSLPK
jgi:hypothetical protein